jgi:hypothetical protein
MVAECSTEIPTRTCGSTRCNNTEEEEEGEEEEEDDDDDYYDDALFFFIWQVLVSNLCSEARYPECSFSEEFLNYLQQMPCSLVHTGVYQNTRHHIPEGRNLLPHKVYLLETNEAKKHVYKTKQINEYVSK